MESTPDNNIAEMTIEQLQHYIDEVEKRHRERMRALRALLRARIAEEAAKNI